MYNIESFKPRIAIDAYAGFKDASHVVPDPADTRLNASSRILSLSSSRGGNLLFKSSWMTVRWDAVSCDLSSPLRMASIHLARPYTNVKAQVSRNVGIEVFE